MRYADIYERAKRDPDGFWMEAADGIDWVTQPSKALFADQAPLYEWFADGTLNTCWNAVDRHVAAGHGPPDSLGFKIDARSSIPQGGKSKPFSGTLSSHALAIAAISRLDLVPSKKELNILGFIPAFLASS